jgi:hypothetical protein
MHPSCPLHTPPLPPGRSLVLISVDPRAVVQLEGLGKLKKIHLIGTQSHYLPAYSIVPQPTMLLQALLICVWNEISKL